MVEQAIWRAIHKDPAQRFQSAAEFRTFLLNAGFAADGAHRAARRRRPQRLRHAPDDEPAFELPAVALRDDADAARPPASQPGAPSHALEPRRAAAAGRDRALAARPPVGAARSNPGLDATDLDGRDAHRQPTANAPRQLKETRVGTRRSRPPPRPEPGAKETRVGPAAAQARRFGRSRRRASCAQQHQARPQSVGSKKWIYIAGAGVAAVVVLGVLVVGGAFFFSRAGRSGPAPVKPAALADKPGPRRSRPPSSRRRRPPRPTPPPRSPRGGAHATGATRCPSRRHAGTALAPIDAAGRRRRLDRRLRRSQGAHAPAQPKPAQPKPPSRPTRPRPHAASARPRSARSTSKAER